MAKIVRTFSIEKELYDWFNKYAKLHSINRSGFITKKIEELRTLSEGNGTMKSQGKKVDELINN